MGYHKSDFEDAYSAIRRALVEIHSPYNDGFTSSASKHELYVLKCWLEDRYRELPTFVGEEKWEQERMIEILKR